MAITSTISINTLADTITTNIYQNGSILIDTITYTNSSNNLLFSNSIAAATLSPAEYLVLLNLYINFNQIIIAVYSPTQNITAPFSSITFIQSDNGSNLNFEFLPGSIPCFYYSCGYPAGNIAVSARNLSATLSYAQWLFFLYLLTNFKSAFLNDYNL